MRNLHLSVTLSSSSDDFSAMLLSSVPMSYESTISAMMTSARITGLDLTPEVILMTLIDNYDQQQAKSSKKSLSEGEDVAYSVNLSRSSVVLATTAERKVTRPKIAGQKVEARRANI